MASIRKIKGKEIIQRDGSKKKLKDTYTVYYKKKISSEKTIRTTKRGFARKKDAEAFIKENERKEAYRIDRIAENTILGNYLIYWIDNIKKNTIKYNTYKGYRVNILNHINPIIGGVKLCDLSIHDLDYLMNMLQENKELNNRTISYVRRVFLMGINEAIKRDYMMNINFSLVKAPKSEKYENNVLDVEGIYDLERVVEGTNMYIPIYLASHFGLRKGECLGLKWRNINLADKMLSVKEQLVKGENGYEISALKTKASLRDINLTNEDVIILEKHKEAQKLLFNKRSKVQNLDRLVVCNNNGEHYSMSSFDKEYKKICKKAGIDNLRFHDLRHSCANNLFNEQIDVVTISNVLGHSNTNVTTNIYIRKSPKQVKNAMNKMGSVYKRVKEERENDSMKESENDYKVG